MLQELLGEDRQAPDVDREALPEIIQVRGQDVRGRGEVACVVDEDVDLGMEGGEEGGDGGDGGDVAGQRGEFGVGVGFAEGRRGAFEA